MVAGGPGTHPPGWVRCHHAPAMSDPFRTADHTGFYLARIVRELRSRIMRALGQEDLGVQISAGDAVEPLPVQEGRKVGANRSRPEVQRHQERAPPRHRRAASRTAWIRGGKL